MHPSTTPIDFKATMDYNKEKLTTADLARAMGRSTASTRVWYHGGKIPKNALILLKEILRKHKVKIIYI
jgi:DNA-binding transcriptional regulator YiaG